MGREWRIYSCTSTLLCAAVCSFALVTNPNFFSAASALGTNLFSLIVLLNFLFVMALAFSKLLCRLLFGSLREIEIEHLYEYSWYTLTETLIAMPSFADNINTWFFLMYGTLLFAKGFFWITRDRVDYIGQTTHISWLYHLRILTAMTMQVTFDVFFVAGLLDKIFKGTALIIPLLFSFECMILLMSLVALFAKYMILSIDSRRSSPWEKKSLYIMYIDLCSSFFAALMFSTLLIVLLRMGWLPIHLLRDSHLALRTFILRIRDYRRYLRAANEMNTKYPDASESDLEKVDKTCIVCREEMHGKEFVDPETSKPLSRADLPKRLPCGHFLHYSCLRSWLERQQTCPICRKSLLSSKIANTTNLDYIHNLSSGGADSEISYIPAENHITGNSSVGQSSTSNSSHTYPAAFAYPMSFSRSPTAINRRLPVVTSKLVIETSPEQGQVKQQQGQQQQSRQQMLPLARLPSVMMIT